jgi:hypothetical protein
MWESGGIAPVFLTSELIRGELSALSSGHFSLEDRPLEPIEKEAEWVPEPVCTMAKRIKLNSVA